MPASNDPVNPDVIGASEEGLRRASKAAWWIAVAAIGVAGIVVWLLLDFS